MNIFLDTNAVVKLYHQEAGTDNLTNFLTIHQGDLIITISDLTKIELHSTFLKRARMKQIDLKTVYQFFGSFDNDARMFNVVEVNHEIKKFAISLLNSVAYKRSLRTLDAIQLSTAVVSHQTIPVDYFVTADKKLLRVANDYFPAFNPEQAIPNVVK
jgi:predicted nucleic acid-binding protein